MTLLKRNVNQPQRELLRLQKEMQGLQNEMEFVEILVQFWPFPNMAQKMERLERRLSLLNQQYHLYVNQKAG